MNICIVPVHEDQKFRYVLTPRAEKENPMRACALTSRKLRQSADMGLHLIILLIIYYSLLIFFWVNFRHGSIVYDNLASVDTTDFEGTMNLLQKGALNRTTASTKMNTQSSRSHAVFTLQMKQTRSVKSLEESETPGKTVDVETVSSKFHFVDLAGSERLKRTGATGDRLRLNFAFNFSFI